MKLRIHGPATLTVGQQAYTVHHVTMDLEPGDAKSPYPHYSTIDDMDPCQDTIQDFGSICDWKIEEIQ